MADNKSRGLTVKVDVDVSEALTGLKALQREAKAATKALRELEEAQKSVGFFRDITDDVPKHVKEYDKEPVKWTSNKPANAWFKDGIE
jgi:hypothetical protein